MVFVFGFGGLVAGAVATVLLMSLDIAQRNTNELLQQTAELSLDGVVTNVHHHLQPPRSQVEYLANQLSAGSFPLDDDGRLQDLLLGSLAAVPQITGVAYVREDLHAVRVIREAGRYGTSAESWLDRPEIRLAIRQGPALPGFSWGDALYLESLRGTYLALRAPVRRDGQFRGLIIAVVSMAELSNNLAATTQPLGGRTFILRGHDEVVAHPRWSAAPAAAPPNIRCRASTRLGDRVLAALWTAPFDPADDILGDSVGDRPHRVRQRRGL